MQQGNQGRAYRNIVNQNYGSRKFGSIKKYLLLLLSKHEFPIISIPALALVTPATIFALSTGEVKNQQQNFRIKYILKADSVDPAEGNPTNHQTSNSKTNYQSTTVSINGKKIAIPSNSEYHKTIVDETSTTKITSTSNSSSSSNGNGSNSNKTAVNVSTNGPNNIRSP